MIHTICMVSDFFYPNVGGVEEHIFQLSQCLINRGHKVIVLTHSYGDRKGIRYMANGLKVYYLPIQPFYNQSVLPTFITSIPLLRCVLIRENISIVHGHSAFSTMAHETMSLARALGLKAVFTDHSLFGFADVSAIVTNNFLSLALADVNRCICVSYVGKENTVLRANVSPEKISVIPNAIDTQVFCPDLSKRPKEIINIIIMCRLQYRKGVDMHPIIIQKICKKYPMVNFIIGGDGPKCNLLEEVRDIVGEDRVKLLGALPHSEVHSVLIQGLINSLEVAIENEISENRIDPWKMHCEMEALYNWPDVAQRTECVYNSIEDEFPYTLQKRIKRFRKCGPLAGTFMIFLVVLQSLVLIVCDFMWPLKEIDIAPDFLPKQDLVLEVYCDNASNESSCRRRSTLKQR